MNRQSSVFRKLMNLSAHRRAWAQGFLFHLVYEGKKAPLKECQSAGLQAIEDDEIEVDFTKRMMQSLGSELKMLGIFQNQKEGRSWVTTLSTERDIIEAVQQFLDADLRILSQLPAKQLKALSTEIQEIKTNKRFHFANKQDKELWKHYWAAYKAGIIDLAFIPIQGDVKRVISSSEYMGDNADA